MLVLNKKRVSRRGCHRFPPPPVYAWLFMCENKAIAIYWEEEGDVEVFLGEEARMIKEKILIKAPPGRIISLLGGSEELQAVAWARRAINSNPQQSPELWDFIREQLKSLSSQVPLN